MNLLRRSLLGLIVFVVVGTALTVVVFVRPYWFSWVISPESALHVQKFLSVWTGVMALGTLFLAYITVKTVEQMRRSQVRASLNEVREWARDVSMTILKLYGPEDTTDDEPHPEITDENARTFVENQIRDMKNIFTSLRSDSVYMERVAKIDPKLENVVKESINELREKIRLLWNYERLPDKASLTREHALTVLKSNNRLYRAIVRVSEEIGSIVERESHRV